MNEQPLPLSTPPTTNVDIDHIRHTNKLKLIWGLICLIAPTVLLIISILAYTLLISLSGIYTGGFTADSTPLWLTISNIGFFLVGGISVLTWLPGIIGGIVLLSTRKHV